MSSFLCSNLFDLDGIGVSGLTVDGASGEQDIIAALEVQSLLCGLLGIVEHNIHAGELIGHNRSDAPAHGWVSGWA